MWKIPERSKNEMTYTVPISQELDAARRHIATLESQLADMKKCDIHQFIHYKPSLDGRKFYEVDDITTIIDKSSK